MPFLLAGSYLECVAHCDNHTLQNPETPCVGSIFAPGRASFAYDCYLKSSLNGSISASIPLVGGFIFGSSSSSTALPASTGLPSFSGTAEPLAPETTFLAASSSTISPATPGPSVSNASSAAVIPPVVAMSQLHGPATNEPTTQYVKYSFPVPVALPSDLLVPVINTNLTTGFSAAEDTGSILSNDSLKSSLAPLTVVPHLSRDGGKGGYLNGQHLFVFCDTANFGTTTAATEGEFLGFVSSSVAIDIGMSGLISEPLTLQDGIGEWSDDVGRLRSFAPMTAGEEAYNKNMSGGGYRYAIWPDSSIIPLDQSHALLYAPLVYDKVNMATQAANFTYLGNTLLAITVDEWGPAAERVVNMMFNADQVEWGSSGGIRSWGSSGIGGTDGLVYIFGKVPTGLLAARTTPDSVANQSSVSFNPFPLSLRSTNNDISQYTYWDGTDWTPTMLPPSSTATFINATLMDLDIFYSPYHLTFIMVYLSVYCDSTFYYRYLLAPSAIYPPFHPSSTSSSPNNTDYVESIVHHPWSDEQVLYKATKPAGGEYIYAGSVHARYYGAEDITMGGTKMLLSWTANTGEKAASVDSGYAIITAEVDLSS